MKSKDLIAFQEGMYDLIRELATDNILFYPLDPSVKPNIYGENKDKVYSDPISLVGSIETFSEPNSQDTSTSIPINGVRITFPTLSLENNNLTPKELDKGMIEFNNTRYNVVEVIPSSLFLGGYNMYNCLCKEIK